MTDPAPTSTATPSGGIALPLAYPQVSDAVSEILRTSPVMRVEHAAVTWKAVAAAFEGARAAGLLTDTPPPPPRWARRLLVLQRRRGEKTR